MIGATTHAPLARQPRVIAGRDTRTMGERRIGRDGDGPSVDFSTIDTAEKAAWLPTLRTPEMMAMLKIITTAGRQGQKLVSNFRAMLCDQELYHIKYEMPDPATGQVNASGTIGNAAVTETWTNGDDGGVHIDGQIGSSPEHLVWLMASDGVHIDGTVGGIEVHETYQPATGGVGGPQWSGTGTIGSKALTEVDADNLDSMVSEGSLGNETTSVQTKFSVDDLCHESLVAEGQVAGCDYVSRQDVVLSS